MQTPGPVVVGLDSFNGVDPMELVGWIRKNYSEDKEAGEAPNRYS